MNAQIKTVSFDGLEIIGDRKFIVHTKKTLKFLKGKTPGTYKRLVLKHLCCVRFWAFSGTNARGEFRVSSKTAYHSLPWYAYCFVHEAYHLELRARGLPWVGTWAELECNKAGRRAGRRFGLPKHLVEYLQSRDGTHWKLPRTW